VSAAGGESVLVIPNPLQLQIRLPHHKKIIDHKAGEISWRQTCKCIKQCVPWL